MGIFENVTKADGDPMFELKKQADSDHTDLKVDLGVGIYRNEAGAYHFLTCVQEAKRILFRNDPGHDYELTTGHADFLRHAAKLVFGDDSDELKAGRVASVQTISGTGANHLGALLIRRLSNRSKVYVGTPAWGNYKPLFALDDLEVIEYKYYDPDSQTVDFETTIGTVQRAPYGSVFVLQACCQNPTGADFTQPQWSLLAQEFSRRDHFAFFDAAYLGFGGLIEDDAYAIRLFAKQKIELLVCQSFSKNLGLYGERVGALHVLLNNSNTSSAIRDHLRSLIRWEFSSSPAFGCRLANIVMSDERLRTQWFAELSDMNARLRNSRLRLFDLLQELKTPGDWSHVLREKGLFSYLELNARQCKLLIEQHHIYLPPNGRINISGLSESNIVRVARAIDIVVHQ